ncbi:pyruvate dehydrogenase complex E1 component subunit beta [Iodidimonas sp. SYSU 1G8]|uniref:pyruvate dehydrogenase complex E1 component subunit beta n=1 Tax=Iodidimonas sp. SYSU 1G8 TaxID=3133967 RepID=UPI0031FE4B2E
MSIDILMPALSPTMEEGTLAKWLVKEGDTVSSGDILAEIETDKATMELESINDGKVAKILVPEGTEGVKVNEVIARLVEEGESADEADPAPKAAKADKQAAKDTPDKGEDGDEAPEVKAEPAPRAPAAAAPRDVEIPAGTEMVEMTVREALRDAMAEEMRANPDVFLMGEEVAQYQGAYKVSQGLLEEFGDKRVIDTPITENGFAGLGTGAAFAGLRPIVEFMTFNFAMQAIDHIVNSAAKTRYMSGGELSVPIVFRGPNGFASRVAAQHSQCYASWYGHIPGLRVIAPYSAADAKGLLKSAIRDPNPVVFLEQELLYGRKFEVPKLDDYTVPIGKAKVVREGKDVTLISFSYTMLATLDAADKLAEQGIDAEVIDLRTIRPLDTETIIESVKKTNRAVVIEQGWTAYGVTAEISALLMEQAFDWLDAPVLRLGGADVPMPYAANLEKLAIVQPDDVVKAAKTVCYKA